MSVASVRRIGRCVLGGVVVLGTLAGATPGLPASGGDRVGQAADALRLSRQAARRAAPAFALKRADGTTFRLAEQRGKVVVLNFWATWCAPCVAEMPTIERLWRAHRAEGLEVLAVSLDVANADLAGFLKKHGVTLPVAADARSEVASAFFVRGLPTTVVLDREGRTVAVAIGPREWDSAAAHALATALLAERAPVR